MEKEQYLRYFQTNTQKTSSKLKPNSQKLNSNHSQLNNQTKSLHISKSKVIKKLLPHITEEYEYKITNQLLLQKIINPKRDKMIVQNFRRNRSRLNTKKSKSREQTIIYQDNTPQSLDIKGNQNSRIQPAHFSLHSRIKPKREQSNSNHKNIQSYEKQYHLALQNQRMGKRIIKTKSSVEELLKKSFFTYKNKNQAKQIGKQNIQTDPKASFIQAKNNSKVYFSGKINNGVKVFFNPITNDEKSLSRSQSLYNTKRSMESYSDKNSQNQKFMTTLEKSFMNIRLRKNKTVANLRRKFAKNEEIESGVDEDLDPHIETNHPDSFKLFGKGPTILMIYDFEIISNPPIKENTMLIFELIIHEKPISSKEKKQKTIRTIPFSYEFVKPKPHEVGSLNCIRFAVNVSGIGDFVPLRIYKLNGVEMQELGIIDIDLAAFRYRKQELGDEMNRLVGKQKKINRQGLRMQRDIISGRCCCNLRKNFLYKPVDTKASLNYKIYSKKYKLMEDNQNQR